MTCWAVKGSGHASPEKCKTVNRPSASRRFWWLLSLWSMYLMATVQVVGCYFTLVRPYVNTYLYENGKERLPFQTRILMMPLMKWAHTSYVTAVSAAFLGHSKFWYLRPAEPEAIMQLWINIGSLIIAGAATFSIYRAASKTGKRPTAGLLAPLVYPLFLLLVAADYILHTIQNFRFLYDLPGIAFFAIGLWLIHSRRHPLFFALLFIVATLNRETTLLLLPFFLLSAATRDGKFAWKKIWSRATVATTLLLVAFWLAWHQFIFHIFKHNVSEYYPRIALNLYTMAHPRYWPQLFSAGGYLAPFVLLFRRSITDPQLRAWIWALPVWFGFMFFWGILVETRVFGELLPYLTCIAILIAEERIHLHVTEGREHLPLLSPVFVSQEAAEEEAA